MQSAVVDVARIFATPPHRIGETSAATTWGTGIEQMTVGFKLYTCVPHIRRFAKELTRKLFPVIGARASRYFVDFDVEAMQVGDSKSQADYFKAALGGNQLPGWMSQNEVRRMKNLPPLADPDADKVYFPPAPTPIGHNGGPPMEPDDDAADDAQAA